MNNLDEILKSLNVNLLILGFPKCATTSFAQWLQTSSFVDLTGPKETYLLCPEYQTEQKIYKTKSLDVGFPVRAEATTLNVYSESLLNVLADSDVKVIILFRDIHEVAESWHMQMKKANFVSVDSTMLDIYKSDFQGNSLKNYKNIFSHGKWVNRWRKAVGDERLLLVNSSDLISNSNSVIGRLESFLGLNLGLSHIIPERNVYSKPRFQLLYDFVRSDFFKKSWYRIESLIPSIREVRVFLREKVLLKKVEKSKGDSKLLLDFEYINQDQKLLIDVYRMNLKYWSEK